MIKIDFVTLFEGMFAGPLDESIIGRARKRGKVGIGFINPRDFSKDRRRRVDERPYGGGAGMVLKAEPIYAAVKSVRKRFSRVVGLSPRGRLFNAAAAARLSRERHLILVCGHYEGMDERVRGIFDEEISIGDYILTGGELPAMVVADAVARLARGVIKAESAANESFQAGLLEHPQYTRPRVWRGRRVPVALVSGDHGRIADWRRRAALSATKSSRPDLI